MEYEELIECTVEEIAAPVKNALVGGPFGSNLVSKDYVPSGIPVIRGQNMGLGRWVKGEFVFVSSEKADSLSANIARPGDIVFTQRGTLGQVAIIPDSAYDRYIVSQSQMKLTVDRNKADAMYLYYLFTSPEQQSYIERNAIRVGVPHTNLGILKSTPLRLPSLSEQKSRAKILSLLDDKIELNRRINRTLEETAQGLFRSWFVDFDPVKAKARANELGCDPERAAMAAIAGKLRVPKDPEELTEEDFAAAETVLASLTDEQRAELAETAALFPAALVESELGLIPEGWEVEDLGSMADSITIKADPSECSPETPYVGLEHIEKQRFTIENWGNANQVDSQKSRFSPNDFLFGKLRPYFHKVCIAPFDGICSTDILVIRPKNSNYSGIVGCHIFDPVFVEYANRASTGTRMPRANWSYMSQYRLVIPPESLAQKFMSIVHSLWSSATRNVQIARQLATLRDTLLPKLLSGEVTVGEATEQVEQSC